MSDRRSTWMPIDPMIYRPGEDGRICLPNEAPFDGEPALILTKDGTVVAEWDEGGWSADTPMSAAEFDGWHWVVHEAAHMDLEEALAWCPLPVDPKMEVPEKDGGPSDVRCEELAVMTAMLGSASVITEVPEALRLIPKLRMQDWDHRCAIEAQRLEIESLRAEIAARDEVLVRTKEFHWSPEGGSEFTLEGAAVEHVIKALGAILLKTENYVEFVVEAPVSAAIVTVQRKNGKTPATKAREAEERLTFITGNGAMAVFPDGRGNFIVWSGVLRDGARELGRGTTRDAAIDDAIDKGITPGTSPVVGS